MRNTRKWQVNFDGGSGTYAANGLAKILLSQLAGQSKTGKEGSHTLLGGLYITAQFVLNNASGGAIIAGWRKAHDFIKRVTLDSDWKYYDFPFNGGQCLRTMRRIHGRNPGRRANSTSIANAGNFTFELDFLLPCFNPAARNPGDLMIPARTLKDVALEMQFCNGAAAGEFGAGVSITSGSLLECTSILVDKNHFRTPQKWSVIERKLNGVNDSTTLPGGHKYTSVGLFPLQSPGGGYADSFFATTDVTKLEYTEDQEILCRNTHPRQLNALFNIENVLDDLVELPFCDGLATDAGTPANDYISVKNISRALMGGYVEGDLCGSSPVWAITGGVTTANTNILAAYVDPTNEDDLIRAMNAAGLQPSPDMLAAAGKRVYSRGHSDTDSTMAEADQQFVPQRLKPNG